MLLGGWWVVVVGCWLWVVGCWLLVVGWEGKNLWIVDGFSLLVTTANSASAHEELFYFPVSVLIQEDRENRSCNHLIITMLQKHSFYTVITMLLQRNNYAFTTRKLSYWKMIAKLSFFVLFFLAVF